MDKALVSGSGSDIPLIQDIEPSSSRARLSHAKLRFYSLAEQCHTQNFYHRCFMLDFDAVKSKFGLLIELIDKKTMFIARKNQRNARYEGFFETPCILDNCHRLSETDYLRLLSLEYLTQSS